MGIYKNISIIFYYRLKRVNYTNSMRILMAIHFRQRLERKKADIPQ
jgi:hypothetical protein